MAATLIYSSKAKAESTATRALAEVVAEHPFLRGLKPAHVQLLAENAMRMHYQANETIFCEGDPANRFYLIEEGKVALESSQGGKTALIQTLGPGETLGWSWLFPPYYWHFDARATEPSIAIFFYGTRLREQCDQDPELGYELMKRMSEIVIQRLQATRRQLLELKK